MIRSLTVPFRECCSTHTAFACAKHVSVTIFKNCKRQNFREWDKLSWRCATVLSSSSVPWCNHSRGRDEGERAFPKRDHVDLMWWSLRSLFSRFLRTVPTCSCIGRCSATAVALSGYPNNLKNCRSTQYCSCFTFANAMKSWIYLRIV